jgi:hypothetical protein
MQLLYVILQEPVTGFFETVIKQYFSYGAIGVIAATFIWLYFKERKKNNQIIDDENKRIIDESEKEKQRLIAEADKEKQRLIAETENSNEKVEVLYAEIKQGQQDYSQNLFGIITKQNEIAEKSLEAMIKSNDTIQKNNNLYEQLIGILLDMKFKK